MKPFTARGLAAALFVLLTLAVAGCGSSVDPALVESAGKHGDVLQRNVTLLESNVLSDINLNHLDKLDMSGDPKNASESKLKQVKAANQKNIDKVAKYRRQLAGANVKLRRTALPEFSKYLDSTTETKKFSADYAKTSQIIRRGGTLVIAASRIASNTFNELNDFLDEWILYKRGGSASEFKSAGEQSMDALNKMGGRIDKIKRQAEIAEELDKLVDSMADAASNDAQLSDLISTLRDDYPDSFLPKHIVEK
jgi:hypothetical protein